MVGGDGFFGTAMVKKGNEKNRKIGKWENGQRKKKQGPSGPVVGSISMDPTTRESSKLEFLRCRIGLYSLKFIVADIELLSPQEETHSHSVPFVFSFSPSLCFFFFSIPVAAHEYGVPYFSVLHFLRCRCLNSLCSLFAIRAETVRKHSRPTRTLQPSGFLDSVVLHDPGHPIYLTLHEQASLGTKRVEPDRPIAATT